VGGEPALQGHDLPAQPDDENGGSQEQPAIDHVLHRPRTRGLRGRSNIARGLGRRRRLDRTATTPIVAGAYPGHDRALSPLTAAAGRFPGTCMDTTSRYARPGEDRLACATLRFIEQARGSTDDRTSAVASPPR